MNNSKNIIPNFLKKQKNDFLEVEKESFDSIMKEKLQINHNILENTIQKDNIKIDNSIIKIIQSEISKNLLKKIFSNNKKLPNYIKQDRSTLQRKIIELIIVEPNNSPSYYNTGYIKVSNKNINFQFPLLSSKKGSIDKTVSYHNSLECLLQEKSTTLLDILDSDMTDIKGGLKYIQDDILSNPFTDSSPYNTQKIISHLIQLGCTNYDSIKSFILLLFKLQKCSLEQKNQYLDIIDEIYTIKNKIYNNLSIHHDDLEQMLVNFLGIYETLILPDTINNIHDAIKFIDKFFSNSKIKELFKIIFTENLHVHIGSINNEDITLLETHKINNDQIKMFYNSFQKTLEEINLNKMVFKLDIGHLINIQRGENYEAHLIQHQNIYKDLINILEEINNDTLLMEINNWLQDLLGSSGERENIEFIKEVIQITEKNKDGIKDYIVRSRLLNQNSRKLDYFKLFTSPLEYIKNIDYNILNFQYLIEELGFDNLHHEYSNFITTLMLSHLDDNIMFPKIIKYDTKNYLNNSNELIKKTQLIQNHYNQFKILGEFQNKFGVSYGLDYYIDNINEIDKVIYNFQREEKFLEDIVSFYSLLSNPQQRMFINIYKQFLNKIKSTNEIDTTIFNQYKDFIEYPGIIDALNIVSQYKSTLPTDILLGDIEKYGHKPQDLLDISQGIIDFINYPGNKEHIDTFNKYKQYLGDEYLGALDRKSYILHPETFAQVVYDIQSGREQFKKTFFTLNKLSQAKQLISTQEKNAMIVDKLEHKSGVIHTTSLITTEKDKYDEGSIALLQDKYYGMYSIGAKLHVDQTPYSNLSQELQKILQVGGFKTIHADTCYNLPPTHTPDELVAILGELSHIGIFNESKPQLQTCHPGRLYNVPGILAIYSLLGSQINTQYAPNAFSTSHDSLTRARILAYDAGIYNPLFLHNPKENIGRTDVLGNQDMYISYINHLVGNLLGHTEYGGILENIGQEFIIDTMEILSRYNFDFNMKNNRVHDPGTSNFTTQDDIDHYHMINMFTQRRESDKIEYKIYNNKKTLTYELLNLLTSYKEKIKTIQVKYLSRKS